MRSIDRLRTRWQFFKHFENPLLVFLLRAGWIRLSLHEYRIRVGQHRYRMLARPVSTTGSDLYVLRDILVNQAYGDVLAHLPDSPLRMVDLGGNIGAFTVWLARQRTISAGYCFEPDPQSRALCRFNLERNDCSHVELSYHAIGGSTRESEIWMDSTQPARSTLFPRAGQSGAVPSRIQVLSLGDWAQRVKGDLDLLKCDIEGSEWELLEEPTQSLRRFRVIIAEVHRTPAQSGSLDAFPRRLEALGFKTLRWDGRDNGIYLGTRL